MYDEHTSGAIHSFYKLLVVKLNQTRRDLMFLNVFLVLLCLSASRSVCVRMYVCFHEDLALGSLAARVDQQRVYAQDQRPFAMVQRLLSSQRL